MTSNARVTVVIVAYQSRNTIDQALASLQTSIADGLADCVLVDNASSDGTADYVAANYPTVKLIRSPGNIGFGRGCNLGYESASTPYVMFLNPDASIDYDSLSRLLDFMDAHESAGIAGPATYDTTAANFQPIGMLLTPMTLIRAALHLPEAFPQRQLLQFGEAPFETNWVCGSSMLVRTSMLREIGGFDPRYFLYFEETDLCLRASRNNYEIWAVGECIARHVGGVSARESGAELTSQQSGCIAKYFYPSRFYYLSKNFGLLRAVGAEVIAACIERTRWVAKKVLGRRPTSEDLPDARLFLRLPSRVDE